jgi:hypothetical protein
VAAQRAYEALGFSGARFVPPASPARDRAHALEATRTIAMKNLFDLGD